jgi:hypothetical protein
MVGHQQNLGAAWTPFDCGVSEFIDIQAATLRRYACKAYQEFGVELVDSAGFARDDGL